MGLIKSGSYSRLSTFEKCNRRAQLAYIDKIPEPERPVLPNGREYPNDRGNRIHDALQAYVEGRGELPSEASDFKRLFDILRQLHAKKVVACEEMWLFDESWRVLPDDAKEPYMRIKLDARARLRPALSLVVDYKSGKRDGNEVAHHEQAITYAVAEFLREPALLTVITEFWYVDLPFIFRETFERSRLQPLLQNIDRRMRSMMNAVVFPPNPSTWTCSYCSYKSGQIGKTGVQGTGHCDRNP